MSAAPAWLVEVVACPVCGGRLGVRADGGGLVAGLLACRRCDAPFPVLGGVAILVADPARYLASHHDAVIAALAERRLASPRAIEIVQTFAEAARGVEAARFSDDSLDYDLGAAAETMETRGHGAIARFADFLAEVAAEPTPADVALAMAPSKMTTVLEIGCGAGALTAELRPCCERLVVADVSLRAVLGARAAASKRRGGALAAVVVDAEELPLRPGAISALFALNLVDLLDAPGEFLARAGEAITRRGRVILGTPDPGLGSGDDGRLAAELAHAGLITVELRDAVPWLRPHTARHIQVYFVRVLAAQRR